MPSVWTESRIAKLKKLWSGGLTTGEIGKILGVSKNAVVGKAHRLSLESRPSPIRRNSKTQKAKVAEEKLFKLVDLTANTCRWPFGDPQDEKFYFCGKNVFPGKTYCEEHCIQAYVKSNRT